MHAPGMVDCLHKRIHIPVSDLYFQSLKLFDILSSYCIDAFPCAYMASHMMMLKL